MFSDSIKKSTGSSKANIILLDIETSPLLGYSWTAYDANILKVVEPFKIISVAWKFLEDKDVKVRAINDYKDYKPGIVDDKNLVKDIWNVLDKADIVIAHNGASFDIKKLNARFIINGLNAPSDYEVIDTLKVAKKYFKFDSNNLNALGLYLDEGNKVSNGGFDLWVRCMAGDKTAWDKMKEYNKGDVTLLERIYLRLRPFMGSDHPNVNLITGHSHSSTACNVCESTDVIKRGFSFTKTGRKQRFQCNSCGSWSVGPFERVHASKSKNEDDDGS